MNSSRPAPFEPEKFENEHRKKLQDMIEKKARGEKIAVLTPRRLKPTESDNLLTTLHYHDEILSEQEFAPKKGKIESGEENRMAREIEGMLGDFDPGKYADGRRRKIMDLLAAKVKEGSLVETPALEEEEGEGPADLVAALEESMRSVREHR